MTKNKIRFVFWAYLFFLFLFVVIKFRGSFTALMQRAAAVESGSNCNLVPLYSIKMQWRHIQEGWARYNLLGNFLPFLPFGWLLPLAYKRFSSWWRVLLIGILSVLLIEVFQYYTRLGSFDVDDILLNTFGIMTGYGIYFLLQKRKAKGSR